MADTIIAAEAITKSFGTVEALRGVDLQVEAGSSSVVRIRTSVVFPAPLGPRSPKTLPTSGTATVDGLDVVRDAEELRFRIGLAGQSAAVDENLTGLENLEMVGRLYHLPREEARKRGGDVLDRFGLSEAADRATKTYSGGMRRRLDLAASLVGRPEVLFLDEPTTGLDPRSRIDVWEFVRELQQDGTTLLLTTQYLEEADQLADRIAVIDHGTLIAEGTSDELKDQIGGEVLEVQVEELRDTPRITETLAGIGTASPHVDEDSGIVRIPVGQEGVTALLESVRRLDGTGIKLADIALRRPTLDDVFLSLTGRGAEEMVDGQDASAQRRGRRGKRAAEKAEKEAERADA